MFVPTRPLCSGNQVTGMSIEGSMIMFMAPAPICRGCKFENCFNPVLDSSNILSQNTNHSVGKANSWNSPAKSKVGEDWSECEEERSENQTASSGISYFGLWVNNFRCMYDQ